MREEGSQTHLPHHLVVTNPRQEQYEEKGHLSGVTSHLGTADSRAMAAVSTPTSLSTLHVQPPLTLGVRMGFDY